MLRSAHSAIAACGAYPRPAALHLDHIGAEQRQLVAAEGSGEHLREVEDANAGEGR